MMLSSDTTFKLSRLRCQLATALPDIVYEEATLIAGSVSAANVLNVDRLCPGCVVVDDSFPQIVDVCAVRRRTQVIEIPCNSLVQKICNQRRNTSKVRCSNVLTCLIISLTYVFNTENNQYSDIPRVINQYERGEIQTQYAPIPRNVDIQVGTHYSTPNVLVD